MTTDNIKRSKQMKRDTSKNCYCYTCGCSYNALGIMSHRAMHRRKKENCKIKFSNGRIETYEYKKDI